MSKDKKDKKKYPKNPEFWWQDEGIRQWYKTEKRKISKEAKARFEKKYGKKKSKKGEDSE